MRKIFTIVASFAILLILLSTNIPASHAQSNTQTQHNLGMNDLSSTLSDQNVASLNNFLVTITGLKEGDVATVTLKPDSASADGESILKKSVIGNITENNIIDMSCTLKDGYYQMNITTPNEYFREPKAWDFMVSDSQLINPRGKSVIFKLISPENQKFQPFRDSIKDEVQFSENTNLEPPSQLLIIMMEWTCSLSAPAKQPQPIVDGVIDSYSYHYFGYQSSLDCPGIWGRFTVVNPGVQHGATGEIACDRIYALDDSNHWMEIGWGEFSWKPEGQYMYEYDSTYDDYRYAAIPANPLEVALESFDSDTWYAMYKYSGSWYTMAYEDIGFTEADYMYNCGEVYTDNENHLSFPSATTDLSKLYINDSWVNWDWQRWATTTLRTCDTYDTHTSTNYYNFYIHKH